ncbi:DUF4340 domain-containing protein [Hyalangium minutum]|uniref:DUF4340 domain-containing protein n=1 Tax=Hyalangium minutum TaxID=394096 RepID=A0A085WHE3_9BACT|nr:DUF4340 domain-containing protein [Hyalangium minutum]KFE67106.1 hypothetical protein DB31_8459 [Hyalangium minutum]
MKQTQKNLVTLVLATAAAAGLGLYAYFGVKEPERKEAVRKEQAEKLFAPETPGEKPTQGATAPAAVFTQLTVQSKGITATLERQGTTWFLTAPVKGKADKPTVEGILAQLHAGKFKATVEEAPTDEDLKKYGLLPPVFSVAAKAYVPDASGGGQDDPARQRTVTLLGGIENTFDGSLYVRRDGDPRVYSADGSVRYALEKDLYALRDKEFLGFEEASLKAIEVKTPATSYSLEREADKSWRLTKPLTVRADGERVKKALLALKEQRALSFPMDSAAERSKLGLDKPVVEARFTLDPGDPVRLRFSLVPEGSGAKVYALREQGSEATLAEVPEGALTVLNLSLPELRTKTVLSFKREDVKRIVFYPGAGAPPAVLSNKNPAANALQGWELEEPITGKVEGLKVASLLSLLSSVKASSFGEANPKWEQYGITDNARSFSLQDTSGKELARLWLGGAVPNKEGSVYARGSNPEVAEVEAAWLAHLPERAEDFLQASATAGTDGGTPDTDGGVPEDSP